MRDTRHLQNAGPRSTAREFARLNTERPRGSMYTISGSGCRQALCSWIKTILGCVVGAAYLIEDAFTDTNGVHLHDHVPDTKPVGAVWADMNGAAEWTISGNKATCSSVADAATTIDSGAADVDIVLASVVPGKYFALLARGDGAGFGYVMGQIQTAEDLLVIAYHDGAYHAIASAAYTVAPTDTIANFEFKVGPGTALEILIDGVSKLSTTSSFNQTKTQIGLYGYTETGA